MKVFIIFSALFFGGGIAAFGQQPAPQPTPAVRSTPSAAIEARQQESSRRFGVLSSSGSASRFNSSRRAAALLAVEKIYRKPNKEESKLLAPSREDEKTYKAFLNGPNAGLVKLIADRGCAEFTSVLNVSEGCLKLTMPGAGASYSFRTGKHRIRRLSDITYVNNSLTSVGFVSHALLVDIGDIPLESVTLQTDGLKFINEFEPVDDYDAAVAIDQKINGGVESGGFFYSRSVPAAENTTFVLRSIAYRGNLYRAVQGFVYDEFDFDERRDVTVAFRIVSRDAESVTILWKELRNQKSPSIKKPDKDRKTEENSFVAKDAPDKE